MQRKRPVWIRREYDQVVSAVPGLGTRTIDAFILVAQEDYTDETTGAFRKEEGTFLRTLGRVTYHVSAGPNSSNACIWSGAIVKISEESLENTFLNDPQDLNVLESGLRAVNLSRLDVLHSLPQCGYSAGFEDLAGGGGVQKATGMSVSQFTGWGSMDFDVRVKRRLKTDEAIVFLVTGIFQFDQEPQESAAVVLNSASVIYDLS